MVLCAGPGAAESMPEKTEPNPWQYGALLDVSYGLNFNFPENHQFRSKQTTPRTNEVSPNMALGYVHKEPHRARDWGMELAAQAGYDTDALVPREQDGRDRPVPGADLLRHLARANVSYLAPIGSGLLLTAGLMKGYINFESFYAKHNFNYSRSYLTDYSPNFVFGVGSRYAINHNVDVGFHVMNGFQYLAHANDLPSYGAELDWRVTKRLVVAQNLYYGRIRRTHRSGLGDSSPTRRFSGVGTRSRSSSPMISAQNGPPINRIRRGRFGRVRRSLPAGTSAGRGAWR